MPIRNIKGMVEYDGTDFEGFQIQPDNHRTVQGEITEVLMKLLDHELKIQGASRTDAGVHATGQIIAFKTSASRTLTEIKSGANKMSPGDWRFIELAETNLQFHPRYDAKSKTYVYLIDGTGSVLRRRYSWSYTRELDIDRMKSVSGKLLGEKDFRSFTSSGAHHNDITIRRIDEVNIDESAGLVKVEITGSGFLYQMVRRIVRALVNVGCDKMSVDDYNLLIDNPEFNRIEAPAPAKGLILKNILY